MDLISRRRFIATGVASGATAAALSAQVSTSSDLTLMLQARPSALELPAHRTAMIVVDMQNDFCSPGGMLDRAGVNLSGVQAIVPSIARTLELVRRVGVRVVFLKMGYQADLSDLGAAQSSNRSMHLALGVGQATTGPDGRKGRILVRDTWNTDIIPALQPQTGDLVIYKTRYSGFHGTDLDGRLAALGIRHLLFAGCTTSVCVESTLRDAMFRDYVSVLLEDCTAEIVGEGKPVSNHQATVSLVEARFGWISSAGLLARAISSPPR